MTIQTVEPARAALERRADVLRSRLASTLSALDRRRRELKHPLHMVGDAIRSHVREALWIGAGAVLLIASAVGVGIMRAHERRKHRSRERMRAIQRLWNHPERIGREEKAPFLVRLARGIVMAILTKAASEAVHLGARRAALPAPEHP